MSRLFKNLISVGLSFFRCAFIWIFHFGKCSFGKLQRFSPNVTFNLDRKSVLHFGSKVRIHSGSKITVRSGAKLIIEDDVALNYGAIIACREAITIKSGTEIGPNVLIYDHDHDFRTKGGLKANKFATQSVEIGENAWIGANTVILKGTKIGKNCVIGAGCVVTGVIEDNTVLIQKRTNVTKKIIEES